MDLEYEQIINSSKSGQELFEALSSFERNNMAHFNSKIDLGGVYLLRGEYTMAKDYFLRAEAVLGNAGEDETAQRNIVIMYASLARISLIEGGYTEALGYIEKAISSDKEKDVQYQFLRAHILTALEKKEEALAMFDRFYEGNAETMTALDLRAYMYLLAERGRPQECARVLDQYFKHGAFFPGLGLFASTVYEKNNEIQKSILSAFLDYEYHASYKKTNSADFLRNLDTLEKRLVAENKIVYARYALNLLRGLYSNEIIQPNVETHEHSFFVEDYVIIKNRILRHNVDIGDVQRLMGMEAFFSKFPVYYWNIWECVTLLDSGTQKEYVRVLEKIIELDKAGVYARPAWEGITRVMGYASQ
jgi:tetratricopeptide (TPR) repeat protein